MYTCMLTPPAYSFTSTICVHTHTHARDTMSQYILELEELPSANQPKPATRQPGDEGRKGGQEPVVTFKDVCIWSEVREMPCF